MENSSANSSRTRAAPTRILFVSLWELGWKTWANQLERYSEDFPNLEAVHLRISRPHWMWALSRELRPLGLPLVSSRRSWEWKMKRTVARAISAERFDVVFVSSQILAPALIEPCHDAGTRFAVALDVTGPAYQRDLLHRQISSRKRWDDERRIYDAADLCVTMSSWIADSLHRDFQVPWEQICVSVPAVAINPSPKAKPERKAGHLPRILFCGNDWKRKGGPRLVRWHQELWSQKAELHITSGTAPPLKNLPNVFHHGVIPYDELVNELMPSSDIFCLPTHNDMSPFAVSDAQAAGLATVSSRIGGMSDLVIEGKTGFLLAPNDEDGFKKAITRLIDDSILRDNMGEAAKLHADEKLNASKVFTHLLNRLIALNSLK
ncbi:D-inositol-3-phosphate glycosyltransferase [Abditibacteriota bacterium]|nr:D-inositol-3-phosphate glycosyltransferase [Abditibacteriota bacterium]